MQDMIEILLDNKQDYMFYIDKVYKHAKYIEYVILDYDNEPNKKILKYFKINNIIPEKVNSWKGTTTKSKNNFLYRFCASPEFKQLLLEFDNFFIINKKEISKNSYSCTLEETEWGKSDIAFYDKDKKIISFIIAHEGDILVSDKYISEFENLKLDNEITYYYGLG